MSLSLLPEVQSLSCGHPCLLNSLDFHGLQLLYLYLMVLLQWLLMTLRLLLQQDVVSAAWRMDLNHLVVRLVGFYMVVVVIPFDCDDLVGGDDRPVLGRDGDVLAARGSLCTSLLHRQVDGLCLCLLYNLMVVVDLFNFHPGGLGLPTTHHPCPAPLGVVSKPLLAGKLLTAFGARIWFL